MSQLSGGVHQGGPYVSRAFYVWSVVSGMLGGLIGIAIVGPARFGEQIEPAMLPPLFLVEALVFGAVAVMYVFYYKMWKALPPAFARTTPGKAIGFLFIPIYNFYWMFKAVWGWTQDFNRYRHERNLGAARAPEGVALAMCILGIIGTAASLLMLAVGEGKLAGILALPNLVLTGIFLWQSATALNAVPAEAREQVLAEHAALAAQKPPVASQGMGITSMVLGIASIVVCYVGLLLGIVAIVLAVVQKRRGRSGYATAGLICGIAGTALWALVIIILVVVLALYR